MTIKNEPINFLTRPDLLSENASDMQLLFAFKSIVMDYARLLDPLEKAATSFFIIHAEEAMPIDNEEIKNDFMFVKEFFLNMRLMYQKICLILCKIRP